MALELPTVNIEIKNELEYGDCNVENDSIPSEVETFPVEVNIEENNEDINFNVSNTFNEDDDIVANANGAFPCRFCGKLWS